MEITIRSWHARERSYHVQGGKETDRSDLCVLFRLTMMMVSLCYGARVELEK